MPGLCRRPQLRMGAGGAWQAHIGAEPSCIELDIDVLYNTPPGGQWQAAIGTTGTTTEPPYPHDPSSRHTVGVIRLQHPPKGHLSTHKQ